VWSKAGRFVEVLHTVGGILTKISANCVINLHAALLFTCLFLWVFPVYVACMHLLLFQYGFVHLQMYLYVYVLHIRLPQEFCVYIFLIACR
jgi:hypothetical protein